MRRMLLFSGLFILMAGVLCVAAQATTSGGERPVLENYDRYIGRDLVTDDRAVNQKIFRPLPLACPPFNLKDKNGDIINPMTDLEPGEPAIGPAVSTKQTCGACHPYDTISHGYHFQTGRNEMGGDDYDPASVTAPLRRDQSPGFFGKWSLLYQRQLTPYHFEDPTEVDMSPWEWVLECGICHPGGGPAEYDRNFQRYDDVLNADHSVTLFGNGDYVNQAWQQTGVMEADCFICHLEGYEYSLRVQEIKKLNFEFAATSGAGLGWIWGSVKKGQDPKVYYNKDIFRADGTVLLHISRPEDRKCMTCHDISSAGKRGQSWHSHYMQDVHTEQGLHCTDCHPGDINHNFAKGSSSSITVRQDLDDTMDSCEHCHAENELGAPGYEEAHQWLPPLHMDRISCQACHITHKPFDPAATVDTIQGKARQTALNTNPNHYDNFLFGAMWGYSAYYAKENILEPFTPDQLAKAAAYPIDPVKLAAIAADDNIPDTPLSVFFSSGETASRLPESTFSIADLAEELGGADNEDVRALMILVLEELYEASIEADYEKVIFKREKTEAGQDTEVPFHAMCVYRGETFRFDSGSLKPIKSTLQPRRPGATIAESPYQYGRAKGDGLIYPENAQLGVFWATMDEGLVRPIFLREMEAAWDYMHREDMKVVEFVGTPSTGKTAKAMPALAPAPVFEEAAPVEAPPAPEGASEEEAKAATEKAAEEAAKAEAARVQAFEKELATYTKTEVGKVLQAMGAKIGAYGTEDRGAIEIYDDNNDSFPEVNTEKEMKLMAWALQQSSERLAGKDLYYIKGESAYLVKMAPWNDPYAGEVIDMDRVGENEPFLVLQRLEEVEQLGAASWDAPTMVLKPVENRIAKLPEASVQALDLDANPAIAQVAQRLSWTASHGVEPPEKALGANGCTDCHSEDSHFFFGKVAVDPFTEEGVPVTVANHEVLGYDAIALKVSAFREGVLKKWAPWIVLIVLAIILLHFALIGAKGGTPVGPVNVVRFRFYERVAHLVSMTTVVFLGVSGFCFLLGKGDPLGHWAREWHGYFGFAAAIGVAAMFLFWFLFMFPAKGDVKWLMKAGGYLGGVKGHLPAGKFNAGQKALFWLAMATMGALSCTGIMMGLNKGSHFPNQEIIFTVHDIAALVMILVLMAHVYLATIVVPHSLRAVFGGKVSDVWAKAHHANWDFKAPADSEK